MGHFLMLLIFFWDKVNFFWYYLFPYTLPLQDLQLSKMSRYSREIKREIFRSPIVNLWHQWTLDT